MMGGIIFLSLLATLTLVLRGVLCASNQMSSKRGRTDLLLRSKRRWVLSTIELVEEDPGPYPKTTTQMFNDRTKDEKELIFHITGMGVTKEPLGVFSIDEISGMVYVHKPIDREKYPFFHINFDILDKATKLPIDRTLSFDVAIQDINDNAPYFDHKIMKATIPENSPAGFLPVQLQAWDIDEENTINSTVTIRTLSQEPKEPAMEVKQISGGRMGQLSFSGCFDYDKAKQYKIIVEAKDHGIQPLSSTATVNVFIADSNTHPPKFKEREYYCEVQEMKSNKEVLRVSVEDKDMPKTPGWQAEYFFIAGNKDANYVIETDPDTNDGILTIVKGLDYERTTKVVLQLGVRNRQALFVCGAKTTGDAAATIPDSDSVNITMKIIDVNDPPKFDTSEAVVYVREGEEPGMKLHTPKVTDMDSDVDKIRFKLVEDPAGWFTIDEKTGAITTAKKIDRESPFVNADNIYKVVLVAIDDGEPPATATSVILVHVTDVNDNLPELAARTTVMCSNKANKVMVHANDTDLPPFSGPFTFALGGDDETLKEIWKLDPATGDAGGLVCLRSLPYGNYSVPLLIQDQQGMVGKDILDVVVCDCGTGDVCRGKLPTSIKLGGAAIGLLMCALLLFLLLLLVIVCQCVSKQFKHIPIGQDEGNQTLIKYNEEGGGSACMTEPTCLLTTTSATTMDGPNMAPLQSQMSYVSTREENSRTGTGTNFTTSLGRQHYQQQQFGEANNTLQSMHSAWGTNRMAVNRGGSARYTHSSSLLSEQFIADHIDRRLYSVGVEHGDYPMYLPYNYTYEGRGGGCDSLDRLSLSNLDSELEFLNDLGPKFKTLGAICGRDI